MICLIPFTIVLFALSLLAEKVVKLPFETYLSGFDARCGGPKFDPSGPGERSNSIFKLEYTKRYNFTILGTTFVYPDHIGMTPSQKPTKFLTDSQIFQHVNSFISHEIKKWEFHISIKVNDFALGANASSEIGHIRSVLSKDTNTVFSGAFFYPLFHLSMSALYIMTQHLSDLFIEHIEGLPSIIHSIKDAEMYKEFFLAYGTHFMDDHTLGCDEMMYANATNHFVEEQSADWMVKQFSLSFNYDNFDLGGSIFKNKTDIHIDKKWLINTMNKTYFRGGDYDLRNLHDLKKWKQSCMIFPTILTARLDSIYKLVEDTVMQRTMAQAMDQYIKTGKVSPQMFPHTNRVIKSISGSELLQGGLNHITMSASSNRIFDFTYDKQQVWTNIYTNISYDLADQIDKNVFSWPETSDETKTAILIDETSAEKYWEEHYKSSGLLGIGSASRDVYHYYYYRRIYDYFDAVKTYMIGIYKLSLSNLVQYKPSLFLSELFLENLNGLPRIYDQEMYFQFLNAFGTSYVKSVVMGGEIVIHQQYNNCLKTKIETERIIETSSWSFLGLIGTSSEHQRYTEQIDKFIRNHISQEVQSRGGITFNKIPFHPSISRWDRYVDSVHRSPSALHYELAPLYDLIEDSQLKANVKRAIREYGEMQKQLLKDSFKNEKKLETPEWCKDI